MRSPAMFAECARIKSQIRSPLSVAAATSEQANHQSPVTNHRSLQPTMPMINFIQIDLAAERIAVNSQQPSSARLVAVEPFQHALDKFLFKFVDRFIEMDSTLHHLANQRIQLLLHR